MEQMQMELAFSPYAIFESSPTPPGLYARQKWLQQDTTIKWRKDYDQTVAALYQGQATNGLWYDSVLTTIQRLFGLHLTERQPNPKINAALDRILESIDQPQSRSVPHAIDPAQLRGLPFAPGPRLPLVTAAVMFLCSIFGRAKEPAVLALYETAIQEMIKSAIHQDNQESTHNLFRAFAVHPYYCNHQATQRMVDFFAKRQARAGDWGARIPFYQALNALAHLKSPAAETQCHRAFRHLLQMQNDNGSWGRSQTEWHTFLAVHALRNKRLI
jgi:hypothetical protein